MWRGFGHLRYGYKLDNDKDFIGYRAVSCHGTVFMTRLIILRFDNSCQPLDHQNWNISVTIYLT